MFDTETTTDHFQRMNFGAARYFVNRPTAAPATHCVEEILLYADDLDDRDPAGELFHNAGSVRISTTG